jgi:hypothetical protein
MQRKYDVRSLWALAKEEKGKAVARRRETNLGTKGKVCARIRMCILSKSTFGRQSFLMKLTEKQ